MVTITDVARAAGVSRSTASYAFSGRRTISTVVRDRVAAAAHDLGYTPNAGARALKTSRTHVIGLLAQFLPDEFAPAMLQYMLGVSDTARDLGYDILLAIDDDGVGALRRLTSSRMVDGVVLLNVAEDDPRLPALRAAHQPGALVGLPRDCRGVDVFDLDFAEAGRLMVDRLVRQGHREILLVSQSEDVVARGGAYVWRHQEGALERAARHGVQLTCVFGASAQPEIGHQLDRLLTDHPGVTALMLNNEAAAAALPGVLGGRGLRVPEDLSVVGRYSRELAETFALPFSAVESAPDVLGRMAVEQLVRRIERRGPDEPHTVRLVAPTLVDRGSIGPPPTP
ncbi:MAG: LacI family DNA-binding transcriptional regulator [Nocardioidaceae bacterium]|nr:LacI family DNA-binding transcriptional regulator [Nocardioidaceae bacterium]